MSLVLQYPLAGSCVPLSLDLQVFDEWRAEASRCGEGTALSAVAASYHFLLSVKLVRVTHDVTQRAKLYLGNPNVTVLSSDSPKHESALMSSSMPSAC